MADLNGDKISHKGQKKHKYSPEVKKQAIAYAEIHGNRPASRHFQVDERRIREWRGRRFRMKVSLRQEVTKTSKELDCVELAENR